MLFATNKKWLACNKTLQMGRWDVAFPFYYLDSFKCPLQYSTSKNWLMLFSLLLVPFKSYLDKFHLFQFLTLSTEESVFWFLLLHLPFDLNSSVTINQVKDLVFLWTMLLFLAERLVFFTYQLFVVNSHFLLEKEEENKNKDMVPFFKKRILGISQLEIWCISLRLI